MVTELLFPDGGKLTAEYEGAGNGTLTLTAEANEGIDRELTLNVKTTEGNISKSISVTHEGKREVFNASDDEFDASDGQLQVLKNGISE